MPSGTGEEKAKPGDILFGVPGQSHSKADLDTLRKKLSKMSVTALRDFYFARWTLCKLEDRSPRPELIQELVTAWKELHSRGL